MKKRKIKYRNVALLGSSLCSVVLVGYTVLLHHDISDMKRDFSSKIESNHKNISLLEASLDKSSEDTEIIKVTLNEVKNKVDKLPK